MELDPFFLQPGAHLRNIGHRKSYVPETELYLEAGHADSARDHFEKLLEIEPDDLAARYNLGAALYRMGEYAKALKAFENVLAADSKHPYAATSAGLCLELLGKPDEARRFYRQAIENSPDEAWTAKARERLDYLNGGKP